LETQLHRTLKAHYAFNPEQQEIRVGRYRVDAVDQEGRLVEVQHAGLSAIRDKIADLLKRKHRVRLVKPIVANKWIVTLDERTRVPQRRRRSPKRGCQLDIFGELLHFTRVFPHKNLIVEVPLLDVEETRLPTKKRWHRAKPHKTIEQRIIAIGESLWLSTNRDLLDLADIPDQVVFDTAELATRLDRPRWFAQQVAYVLGKCGATEEVGKRGNTRLYQAVTSKARRSSSKKAA
jgi:hypothetical protein